MWDRKLWGVEFSGPDIPPYLIDASAEYAGRTDDCAKWRFRPVQVRERVEKEA